MNKRFIKLYVERTFSMKFSDTSDFIIENWKPLFRYISYFILPLSLVEGVNLSGYFSSVMSMNNGSNLQDDTIISMLVNVGVLLVLSFVASVITSAVVYALMKIYQEREEKLNGLTMSILKPYLISSLKKSAAVVAVIILLCILLFAIDCALIVVHPLLFFLGLIALLVVTVPMALTLPMAQFEDIKIFAAIKKSFVYGFKTWGGVFSIIIILSMITSMFCGVLSIPMYILIMLKSFTEGSLDSSLSAITNSGWYTALTYLSTTAYIYVYQLGASIMLVGLAYQYGHAAAKIGDKGIVERVDNFEELGAVDDEKHLEGDAEEDAIDSAFKGI